ncbi:MAG TPA: secretin and TonB N-terminal domain-containing protein [Burkholderiales bacterium]|nr:secretin and TonB N-terminal domain-containing protein [Burkholderiales bacterium]
MRRLLVISVLLAASCALPPPTSTVDPSIQDALSRAEKQKAPPAPPLEPQLLPPLRMEMPKVGGEPIDQRFDLSVANAPATQVFSSLVAGTRYSMLVPPNVAGNISLNLKDVTLREALDAIREVYGYEYRIEGTRIFIQPPGIQARVFQVNYLAAQRRGLSQLRVNSNTLVGRGGGLTPGTLGASLTPGIPGGGAGSQVNQVANQIGGAQSVDSTRITTNQEAMFWSDLCEALVAIAFPPSRQGAADAAAAASAAASAGALQAPEDRQRASCNRRHAESDRSIVVSPQSGIVVVRATPAELRSVEDYLRATRLAVERQVMLEAKIIEVTLSDQFQSGINWTLFSHHVAVGQATRPLAAPRTLFESSSAQFSPPPPTDIRSALRTSAEAQLLTGPAGAVVGVAASTNSFASLVTFLETQGNVQVLSSPRVATINNQKAVLKVGQDELFVSNVTVTPPTIGTVSTPATVSPEFQPYFSGIVLDVTPQIDERGMITLHIHPTINDIVQVQRVLDLGSAGSFNVPTARNTIRETDTIVRVADSSIVAIGGLMRTEINDVRGGLPGAPDWGPANVLLRSTNRVREKKELVILLKPTILESDRDWSDDAREARERMDALGRDMAGKEMR